MSVRLLGVEARKLLKNPIPWSEFVRLLGMLLANLPYTVFTLAPVIVLRPTVVSVAAGLGYTQVLLAIWHCRRQDAGG